MVILPFASAVLTFDGERMTEAFTLPVSGRQLKRKAISDIHNYSIFKSFELKNKGVYVGYTSIYETKSQYILSYYNLEYLIIDKNRKTATVFRPECDMLSENIESFYDIFFADDTYLVSVNNQSMSSKSTLVFYHLK